MAGDFAPFMTAGTSGDALSPHAVQAGLSPAPAEDGALDDGALIALVRSKSVAAQTSVARRQALSPAVCDTLAELAAPTAVAAMLENDTAKINHATLMRLVERSRDVIAFRVPLLRRREMNRGLAKRLYLWASPPLREFIARSFQLDVAELERERIEREPPEQPAAPANTPSSLVEHLRQGQNLSFEASFARLVGLRITAVRRILEDRAGDRLAVACRASGFTSEQFQDAYRLIQSTMARVSPRDAAGAVPRLASLYDRMDPEEARQTLRRWRRELSDSADPAPPAPAGLPLSSAVNS